VVDWLAQGQLAAQSQCWQQGKVLWEALREVELVDQLVPLVEALGQPACLPEEHQLVQQVQPLLHYRERLSQQQQQLPWLSSVQGDAMAYWQMRWAHWKMLHPPQQLG
jgi:hypothetical protein